MFYNFLVKYYDEDGNYRGQKVESKYADSQEEAKEALEKILNKWHKGFTFTIDSWVK